VDPAEDPDPGWIRLISKLLSKVPESFSWLSDWTKRSTMLAMLSWVFGIGILEQLPRLFVLFMTRTCLNGFNFNWIIIMDTLNAPTLSN